MFDVVGPCLPEGVMRLHANEMETSSCRCPRVLIGINGGHGRFGAPTGASTPAEGPAQRRLLTRCLPEKHVAHHPAGQAASSSHTHKTNTAPLRVQAFLSKPPNYTSSPHSLLLVARITTSFAFSSRNR